MGKRIEIIPQRPAARSSEPGPTAPATLEDAERETIIRALRRTGELLVAQTALRSSLASPKTRREPPCVRVERDQPSEKYRAVEMPKIDLCGCECS
jgi:hypothetical protein